MILNITSYQNMEIQIAEYIYKITELRKFSPN